MRRFGLAAALLLGLIFATAAQARSYIVALPANLSPAFVELAEGIIAGAFDRLQSGDTLIGFDATHLSIIGQITVPATIGTDAKARAREFGELEGKINDVIEEPDKSAAADDINIPVLLREIGLNVLPKLSDHDVHTLLIGSVIWADKGTNWSFRENLPSDGFLVKPIGVFAVTGQETSLAGSLTSICYTDKITGFAWEGFRQETLNFWAKSIVGRGGKVGGLQPIAADCPARLFSMQEDKTPYTINRGEAVFLRKMHWVNVDVR
jgi:hypothetical protein